MHSLKTQKTILANCTPTKPRRPFYETALSQNPEDHSIKLHYSKTQKNTPSNFIFSKPRRPVSKLHSLKTQKTTLPKYIAQKPEGHSTKKSIPLKPTRRLYQTEPSDNPEVHSSKTHTLKTQKTTLPNCTF